MTLNVFDWLQFAAFFGAIGFFLLGAFARARFRRFEPIGMGMALWAIAMAVSIWTTVCRGD
jgi:hypothetical protein